MDLGLAGKRVLITGASRGIGRSAVHRFAQEGASMAICARNEAGIDARIDALRGEAADGAVRPA